MISKAKERLIGRLRTRRRGDEERVLVEGRRAVVEALAAADADFAVVSASVAGGGDDGLADSLISAGVELHVVEDSELEELSDTESPQGVLLVCREPKPCLDDVLGGEGGVLMLDRVQDPGNLGTLVRAARAFDLSGVVALDGTVDPWNPKAVRAAAGMCFRLPVLKEEWSVVNAVAVEKATSLWVAEAGGADVRGVDVGGRWALVVGNEGDGARGEVKEEAAGSVAVPMSGGADSLNVAMAGSILLFALAGRGGP